MKNARHLPGSVLATLLLFLNLPVQAQAHSEMVYSEISPATKAQESPIDQKNDHPGGYRVGVGMYMLATTGRYYQLQGRAKQFNNYHWTYQPVGGKESGCFALPDGRIAVSDSLARSTGNDDQLAYIVGHAIAHVILGHTPKGNKLRIPDQFPFPARAWAGMENFEQMALDHHCPYSTANEQDADKFSLIIMQLAGYDPQQSIAFWQRISDQKNAFAEVKSKALEARLRLLNNITPEIILQYKKLPQEGPITTTPSLYTDTEVLAALAEPQPQLITALKPLPTVGTHIFILIATIPVSKIQADKIAALQATGAVFLEKTTVEGFSYVRVLVGDCPDLQVAKNKCSRLKEQGFVKPQLVEYINGRKNRYLY